jgi:hypothetical protein
MRKFVCGLLMCAGLALPVAAQYGWFPPPADAIDAVMIYDIPWDRCGDLQEWAFYMRDGSIETFWYYFPNGQCQ